MPQDLGTGATWVLVTITVGSSSLTEEQRQPEVDQLKFKVEGDGAGIV